MNTASRLLEALQSGEELTAKQIETRFGVSSGRGLVFTLRSQGYAVYLNRTTNSKGRVVNKYRLGTPNRAMVAAAFKVFGAQRLGMTAAGA